MIIYHPLQKEDVRYLVDLFNEQFIFDPITEKIMTEKIFLEENYDSDLNFIVKQDNVLAGFASGYVKEYNGATTGWIKLMAAVDQCKLGVIFQDIFNKIETKLIQKGAQTIRFFDCFPNYFTSGIDPRYTSVITLLHKRGYEKRRDNVQMVVDLTEEDFSTERMEKLVARQNIIIKRAEEADQKKVLALIDDDFHTWKPEIYQAFQKKAIPLHIALHNKKVIAFANHSCNNAGLPWFGPMGTTEKAQGKGLGELLLKRCLQDLKTAGFKEAIIPWVGPIGFYFQKCGAKVDRVFWNYTKNITPA